MKAKLKTLLLIVLLLVLMIMVAVKEVNAAGYEDWNKYFQSQNISRTQIIGRKDNTIDSKIWDVSKNEKVQIQQFTDAVGWDGSESVISILNQPHVYCAQHGASLHAGEYSVSEEYTVTDSKLAYILYNGPSMNNLEENYATEASQIALWYYLDNNNGTTDETNILGDLTQSEHVEKNDLYKNAEAYATNLNSITPTLTLSLNGNELNVQVGGSFTSFDLVINGAKYGETRSKDLDKDYETNIDVSGFTTSTIEVKVKAYKVSYNAKYVVLSNPDNQKVIVVTAVGYNDDDVESETKTVLINTDVSLQKYITKVNGIDITRTETNLTTRVNKKTASDESNDGVKNAISKNNSATNYYKRDYPVKIEAGDTVTYRVYVYNNSNINAQSVIIKDSLPHYNSQSYVSIESIKKDGTTDVTWDLADSSNNTYSYTLSNLAGGASTFFDITVKFNTFTGDNIISNTAWISSTTPTNKKEYRTVDRDYIQMYTDYKVSLEKFVTEVTDGAGGNVETYNDRSGKRYNEGSTHQNAVNYNTWKSDNKVQVEPGDIVTFTIRLKNTGTRNVKITKIYDTAIAKSSGLSLILANNSSTAKLEVYNKNGIKQSDAEIKTAGDYKGPNGTWELSNYKRYEINFNNATLLAPNDYVDVKIKFKVEVPKNLTLDSQSLYNKAGIIFIENKNNVRVDDYDNPNDTTDGTEDNYDMDWLVTKVYKVSLEKYISKVNGKELETDRDGNDTNSEDQSEHKYDNKGIAQRNWKYKNPVTVSNGDKVTYTIKVKNDGDTFVKITNIADYLPNGIKYKNKQYRGKVYCTDFADGDGQTENTINFTNEISLNPKASHIFNIEIEVIEPNISNNILKNVAEIISMVNRNTVDLSDSTDKNNKDADYIQLDYEDEQTSDSIIIGGYVWNDIATDKIQNYYNGLLDEDDSRRLSGIKVMLYRQGTEEPISIKYTDANGYYSFGNNDVNKYGEEVVDVIKNEHELYIKGPKVENTNRWEGSYYSYYVVFEYDGVKYTSTPDGKSFENIITSNKDYRLDSNAREKLASADKFNGNVASDRITFNNKFNPTPNANITIDYDTKNEEKNYIPQSNHEYNNSTMNMQSSTELIELGSNNLLGGKDYSTDEDLKAIKEIEDKLKYIGLGLRGRDIFDLELTSDVDNIKVTVNEQEGEYKYTNKVELRSTDIPNNDKVIEDMANIKNENINANYVDGINVGQNVTADEGKQQHIRLSDYDLSTTGTTGQSYNMDVNSLNYQGISKVLVTYKIVVHNASNTVGTATKIINYYDSKYTINNIIPGENCSIKKWETKQGGNGYNCVEIWTTESKMLNQSENMEFYIQYSLGNPKQIQDALNGLSKDNPIPTYNMTEILEYKTKSYAQDSQNKGKEYTRGLIDKDSAPGSANTEKVRLTEGSSNLTTVSYYFAGANLNKLKYEDDTYASPTLYFVIPYDDIPGGPTGGTPSKRVITGTVFEDYTRIIGNEDEDIRVKTGDGVQDTTNNKEPGIEGITVKLYEGNILRYKTETDRDGNYTFEGFLPGNYTVKYEYGDTNKTFLLNDDPNTKSYNGEDFQSTNNTGKAGGQEYDWIKTLNNTTDYWYVYNENDGISTATDVVNTRQTVSTTVTNFTDSQMTVLNNARDGMSVDEIGRDKVDDIREKTQMESLTKSMKLTMEKTVLNEKNERVQNKAFTDYVVTNMNFGIAEVPVTTIDMQKHVHSFTITDSTGTNLIAGAEIDTDNTSVVVNASKIAVNRLEKVIDVLSENLGIKKEIVRDTINYDQYKSQDINIHIAQKVDRTKIDNLKNAILNDSLAREIKILYGWKVTAGAVKAEPGISTIFVEIEDDKLQGAKLEVVYEISANIYAEKNFNNESVTVPTIEGMVDYIDNDLSYDESNNTIEGNNSQYWSVTTYDAVQGLFEGQGNGTLDPEGRKYSTIVSAKEDSAILQKKCGEGKVYITLEKVLSSTDSTLESITFDSYEYTNTVEITKLNYENQTGSGSSGGSSGTGGSGGTSNPDGENDFVFKDRVRTPDRFIIVPGMSHDYQAAETISISPPTGDSSISTVYYVIAAIALTVVAVGIFGIKKFVIKK